MGPSGNSHGIFYLLVCEDTDQGTVLICNWPVRTQTKELYSFEIGM